MKTFFAQTAADAPPASPTGARGKHDFTPARRRPLRGNTMKMFTFGSALAIAAACAATSVYAKPSGNPAGHAAAGHVAGHVNGAYVRRHPAQRGWGTPQRWRKHDGDDENSVIS